MRRGGALSELTRGGRGGLDLLGEVERLTRATGIFAIAASSAGDKARESKGLGRGVLS